MISVIVPVYKAEKYLRRCIDSVLAQTSEDWELILVDDGSPDNSGFICDEYAKEDSRIRVFHKENGGVSSARNMGLDSAQGEWVSFLDADDYLSVSFLDGINGIDYDLIIGYSNIILQDGSTAILEKMPQANIKDNNQLKSYLEQNLDMGLMRTPWGKLIKRTVIGGTRFAAGQNIGEDTLFMLQILFNVQSLAVDNNISYYWQKDVVDDRQKYRLSPGNAVKYVNNIYSAYKELDIYSSSFERCLLTYFFDLCDKRKAHQLWFNDSAIKEMLSRKPNLPALYDIWRTHPIIAPFYVKLYVFMSKIKGKLRT